MTEVLSIKALPSYSRQIFLPGSQASHSTARWGGARHLIGWRFDSVADLNGAAMLS